MSPHGATTTYEVHLGAAVTDELDVASPVETDRIDYYDSGLWVSTADGRDFYPYAHVLTIRERPPHREETGSAEREATDEGEATEGDAAVGIAIESTPTDVSEE